MPSRKNGDAEEPDRVLNWLNHKLKAHDLKQAKEMLVTYLYNNNLDPAQFKVNTSSVNSLIGHLEDEYMVW